MSNGEQYYQSVCICLHTFLVRLSLGECVPCQARGSFHPVEVLSMHKTWNWLPPGRCANGCAVDEHFLRNCNWCVPRHVGLLITWRLLMFSSCAFSAAPWYIMLDAWYCIESCIRFILRMTCTNTSKSVLSGPHAFYFPFAHFLFVTLALTVLYLSVIVQSFCVYTLFPNSVSILNQEQRWLEYSILPNCYPLDIH